MEFSKLNSSHNLAAFSAVVWLALALALYSQPGGGQPGGGQPGGGQPGGGQPGGGQPGGGQPGGGQPGGGQPRWRRQQQHQ